MTPLRSTARFPGESAEYRHARDRLLQAEDGLRRLMEEVASLRRDLPPGGLVPEDYVFEEVEGGKVTQTRLSALFESGKNSLIVYSYMFGPQAEEGCPLCTSFLDGLDGSAPHIAQRVNLAVVGRAPIGKIRTFANGRAWKNLRLLSSNKNSYHADYLGETPEGDQMPMANVFHREPDGIHHFWGSELLYAATEGHPRHIDILWPLWSFFDLTPEGRGEAWLPELDYE